jgi:hypothetical protein
VTSPLQPPDRDEYARFCNAIAEAIKDLAWEPLTVRYRIAAQAWRTLHPESRCGL